MDIETNMHVHNIYSLKLCSYLTPEGVIHTYVFVGVVTKTTPLVSRVYMSKEFRFLLSHVVGNASYKALKVLWKETVIPKVQSAPNS